MSTVSVREQIKKLVELQKIDSEVYRLRRDLEEKPVYLEQLKQRFEAQKANLKALEDKSKSIQVARKGLELDLQTKEGDIAKANASLSQIKTNKEYQAKLLEIEHLKADKSLAEEKILMSFDESDAVLQEIAKEKEFVAQEEKKYLAEKVKIEESVKLMQTQVSALESQHQEMTPQVDKEIFSRYDRIVKNKEGIAVVPISGSSCGGCFMNVPQQTLNEIKMHDKLVFCEMCARILYLEDEL